MEATNTRLGDWAEQVERFLLTKLADRELCRDLAQEAVSRLLQATQAGKRVAEPRAWLFRTARNLAVDAVRRRLPSPLGLELLTAVPDPESLEEADQEPCWDLAGHPMRRGELVDLLPRALDHLPDHYRRVLAHRYLEGVACETVAGREQISHHNLKVRVHRARRRLKELLVLEVRRDPDPRPFGEKGA